MRFRIPVALSCAAFALSLAGSSVTRADDEPSSTLPLRKVADDPDPELRQREPGLVIATRLGHQHTSACQSPFFLGRAFPTARLRNARSSAGLSHPWVAVEPKEKHRIRQRMLFKECKSVEVIRALGG